MGTPSDVYRCLAETLDARLRSESAHPPETELRRLEADRNAVRLHSRIADQPVTYGQASFCRECGEPAPCETIRGLSERYGCDGAE